MKTASFSVIVKDSMFSLTNLWCPFIAWVESLVDAGTNDLTLKPIFQSECSRCMHINHLHSFRAVHAACNYASTSQRLKCQDGISIAERKSSSSLGQMKLLKPVALD